VTETPASDLVLLRTEDGVATVTLNRPEARNALSGALLSTLRATLGQVERDPDIGAVILTGADPAFCAGLDLKELSAGGLLGAAAEDAELPVGAPWTPLTKPVIGAVNGVAVTGGLELALNCDFLIASERAAFADTHARVGVLPGWGLSVLLPQRVGFAMARRLSFTGDYLTAADALRSGLVTQVVPHGDLLPVVQRVAATIAANHRPAIAALHASYRKIETEAVGDGIAVEAATSRQWTKTGGTQGIAGRVGGVFRRGREQVGHGEPPA
jgi:enoyl-CoA hydratase